MKQGAGSDLESESFARPSSACIVGSSALGSDSGCGAPQLRAPVAARAARKTDLKEMEIGDCLIGVWAYSFCIERKTVTRRNIDNAPNCGVEQLLLLGPPVHLAIS